MPFPSVQPTIKGEKGAFGLAGRHGDKGQQGTKGEPGKDGLATKVIFALDSVLPEYLPRSGIFPPNFDGEGKPEQQIRANVGESIVYTPDGTIWCFQPRSGFLGWINIGTIATEITNISGDKGEQGADGLKGEKGESGTKGEPGIEGQAGIDGIDGQDGTKGEVGAEGQKGSKGDAGSNGVKGAHGYDGKDGAKGSRGRKGEKGNEGSVGPRGEQGHTGNKGEKGSDATVLGLGLIPKAAIHFNGIQESLYNSFNIGALKRLDDGRYRLRFERKLDRDDYIVTSQAYVKDNDKANVRHCVVTTRTKSYCIVEVTNPATAQHEDATNIDVLIYCFTG